jgi:hypothetical protein
MDRGHLEHVIPQVGRCGIWCGSCVVGNGALMELARRYAELVESHGLEHWGADGFDYSQFVGGLGCISELEVCPGCLSGGGRDDCELRSCAEGRGLGTCTECKVSATCEHREVLDRMRTGARRAGLAVIESSSDADSVTARGELELRDRWWWRAVFDE